VTAGGDAPPSDLVRDHYVVCGAGPTGRKVIEELSVTGRRYTVVEQDAAVVARLRHVVPAEILFEGDATDEDVLLRAGVDRARCLVTTLADDKANLVVTVTALGLNPRLRVVARGTEEEQWARLRREGALVVSPNHIGGRRLATTMIHPAATSFLNEMLAAPSDLPVRFEAVEVVPGSEADGKTLDELRVFERTGLLVVACRRGTEGAFSYNPPGDTRLAPGHRLVVIGDWHAVDRLAAIAGRWE